MMTTPRHPGQYFHQASDKKKFSRMSEKISWMWLWSSSVLKSYVYTGATRGTQAEVLWYRQHAKHCTGAGRLDYRRWDARGHCQQRRVCLAQSVIRGGEKKPVRKHQNIPCKGLVCCGNCKRVMTRRKQQKWQRTYQCCHSTHDRDTDCPSWRTLRRKGH